MKTFREQKSEKTKKLNRKIWGALKIEKVVKIYGFPAVKYSIGKWLQYQRESSSLLKEQTKLKIKLSEIEDKL